MHGTKKQFLGVFSDSERVERRLPAVLRTVLAADVVGYIVPPRAVLSSASLSTGAPECGHFLLAEPLQSVVAGVALRLWDPPTRHVYITLFGAAAAELEKYISDKKMAPIKGPYLEFTLHLFVHLFHLFRRVMVMMVMMVMMHWLCHRLRIFRACD